MADRRSNYVIALKVDGSVRVTREFDKVGDKGEKNFKKIRKSAGRTNQALAGMARNVTSTLVPAFAAAASASSIFRNIQTFEKLDIRLRSLTSSAEDYANTQDYLKSKADELNVGIETLSDGYARLLVLQNSGILNREQVNQLSEGLVNAAAQLGASGADIDRVLFGLSQGLSSGTLRAEELNQVVEPLPGLLQELDKAAGLSAGGFRRLVNSGEVTAEMFATTLVTALESYDGAAAKLDGTISGSLARLNNAWVELARTIGESGIVDFLADLTQGMATSIDVALKATNGQLAFAEATGVVEKTAFVTARAVKGAFLLLQSGILVVADAVVATVEDMFNKVRFVLNLLPGIEIQALQSLKSVREAINATINDNRRAFFDEVIDFGPSAESIRAIREQEARVKELQRQAVQAKSEANQARVAEERRAKAGPTKAEKEAIKQLDKERKKIEQVTQALKFRNEQLLRDRPTQELYNQLKAAGVELLSREGQAIQALVQEYFQLKEAEERRTALIKKIREVTEENSDVQEVYNQKVADLQSLLDEGRISLQEFKTGAQAAYEELIRASDHWLAGATRALQDYAEEAKDMATQVESVISDAAKGLEDALVAAATTGKFEFKSLVDSIISDIARITIRQNITAPLAQGLNGFIGNIFGGQSGGGGFFGNLFADGGAFQNGQQVTAFAKGGLVDQPTIFPMANGMGLMGEAGPEAVLPLTRMSSGRLGVDAQSTTASGDVHVTVINNTPANVGVKDNAYQGGTRGIQVMIDEAVAQNINTPGSRTRRAISSYAGQGVIKR